MIFSHNSIIWSTYPSPCTILHFCVCPPVLTLEHILLRNFNSFLKVCAFDETLVLFAFLFTSTVTYVPDPPSSQTMTAFALSSTTPFRHHWKHPMSPTPTPAHQPSHYTLAGHSHPSHIIPCVISIRFTVFVCYLPFDPPHDSPPVDRLLYDTPWMNSTCAPCPSHYVYTMSPHLATPRKSSIVMHP